MKIINGKQLADMPNGTVFSDIVDNDFNPNGANGDMAINGLSIMAGHNKRNPVGSGYFNGVLHMLGYVSCTGTQVDTCEEDDKSNKDPWDDLTDTDQNDYTENDWVVVYEKEEIEEIIRNLRWALNDCKEK